MLEEIKVVIVLLLIFAAYGYVGSVECQDAQRGYAGTSLVFVAGR